MGQDQRWHSTFDVAATVVENTDDVSAYVVR